MNENQNPASYYNPPQAQPLAKSDVHNYTSNYKLSAIDENPEIEDDALSPQVLNVEREQQQVQFSSLVENPK